MTTEVLQLCPFSPLLEQELRARFVVHPWFSMEKPREFLAKHATSIRAVVTGGHLGISAELMAALPNLGIVAINGVGFDKVDLDEAKRRNVRVTTTPGVLTADVADLAAGLVIGLLRGIPQADRYVREQRWLQGDRPLARKVSGRKFGIVGLGNIGQAIADRLTPFGPVGYCDLERKAGTLQFFPNAVELARWSDVLILASSANTATRRMVGRDVLDALGADGYLVNVARGSLVDEDELVRALLEHRIAGAALDVFADEPNVPERLLPLDNVVLTPHVASATVETREAMARAVLTNLDAYFAGQSPPGAIA
jgi:lactate dehydrogenase-like 2-hydroxyacid dehydrogenase